MVSFPPVSPARPYTPPLLTHTHHMPSPSHSSHFVTRTMLGEEFHHISTGVYNLTSTINFVRFASLLPDFLFSPFPLVLPLVLSPYSIHLVDFHRSFCLSVMSNFLKFFSHSSTRYPGRYLASSCPCHIILPVCADTLCATRMPCC